MSEFEYKYLFGPVPSRRLGLSLGVDIVPLKTCTQDCVYCQLGKFVDKQVIQRKSYVNIDDVIFELVNKINAGLKADFITISGSGEPTLNVDIGLIIDRIKKTSDIPVAVITNGTLLFKEDVRNDLLSADLVIPSIDAFDQRSFEKINRPHSNITFDKLIYGIKEFTAQFNGQVWLEVFIVEGLNTSDEQIIKLKDIISLIRADKVQLNTAVRPTADSGIKPVSPMKLKHIAALLGSNVEVVADTAKLKNLIKEIEHAQENIYLMLKRRPCSIKDISKSLGINPNVALKYITNLLNQKKIVTKPVGDEIFYSAV